MGFEIKAIALAIVLSIVLSACGKAQAPQDNIGTDFIDIGQKIVETRCAFCHNPNPTGDSPRADAPPLRTVLSNYNPDALADDFRERIHVGHPDMPDFDFTVKEVDGLLAYLLSIQTPAPDQQ